MPQIDFVMLNGDKHTLTIPEEENMDEVLQMTRDDPGQWITADDGLFLRRANVISMRLLREQAEPMVSFGS